MTKHEYCSCGYWKDEEHACPITYDALKEELARYKSLACLDCAEKQGIIRCPVKPLPLGMGI